MIAGLWRQRELIDQFTRREIRARFEGTVLGFTWTILEPLSKLIVFTTVFVALGIRFGGQGPDAARQYAVHLFCGLIVFGIFSETVTKAPVAVAGRVNLVKRVQFPLEILPVSLTLGSLATGAVGLVLVALTSWILLGGVPATAALMPVMLIPLLLLSLGTAWFLASLGVFLRDIRQATTVVVGNLLFFLTPVIYPLSLFDDKPAVRALLLANPLTMIVEDSRGVMLEGRMPHWEWWGLWTGVSAMICLLGYVWFMKSRRGFSDVV